MATTMASERHGSRGLFLKALAAFLALPGIVAFLAPWLLLGPDASLRHLPGLIPGAAGVVLLLACVREFYVAGTGTLAPWSPPIHLVTTGPYGRSRNPMYVAVALILGGWAWTFAAPALVVYMLVVVAAFQVRVVFGEEPWLVRRHGDAWLAYRARVRRWL